ncbi:MAG: translation initiation factor IF-2 [Sulfurovum sp. PC08-66]|nr:MAG: translation initiation factor IF-2 [Sulfurovum sp. PC08-66]KIM12402.1 MAG: translation initiation factor IF-2 [Sulfuricurvum sp. PC08-66]
MDKVRISDIAKELGAHNKDVLEKAIEMGLDVKAVGSTITMDEAERLANYIMSGPATHAPKSAKPTASKESSVDSKETPTIEAAPALIESALLESEAAIDEIASADESGKAKRGLTIVKKKKPLTSASTSNKSSYDDSSSLTAEEAREAVRASMSASAYGKLSEEAKRELANKKRKAHKKVEPSRHEHGDKIDIFGNDFGSFSFDLEEEQVQLIDYRDEEAKLDLQEQIRKEQEEMKALRVKQQQQLNGKKKAIYQPQTISRTSRKKRRRPTVEGEKEQVNSIEIPEDIRVYEFAEKINKTISEVITVLFNLGMMVTKNDFLGKDEIEILAEEFNVEVHTIDLTEAFNYVDSYEDAQEDVHLITRAPIVTIMGHVDHGKTSLLDFIRSSRVAAKEAGGITQHIGAYSVEKNGKMITFLDTPGHAAFSAMRARGAQLTDIIIIVVAADDGVKPQTIEAIKHAKESGAPILVAMNKMDKADANPDMVKAQMAERGLNPSDWGGDIDFVGVSAKTGKGVEDLLEHILISAEILELKANPAANAKATVVESSIEKGRGPVATVVVQNGTLRIGDNIVAGASYGRVKAMLDANKAMIKEAGPSHTCVVVGLDSVPSAGEVLIVTDSEKEAKDFAFKRHEHDRHKELSKSTKASLDELSAMIAEGNLKALKVILKADVHGSLEAIRSSLEALRNEEVKVSIIASAVGGITQNDVDLARNSDNVVILGFNVRPTGDVKASAKQAGVEIKTYSIIYEMIDDITATLSGMMSKRVREENTGQATIREIFGLPKGGKVAGCMVDDGKIVRGGKIRVIRDGVVMHVTKVSSLRRFKDEVKEVSKGYECGIMLDNYNEIAVGDVFETFIEIEEKQSL